MLRTEQNRTALALCLLVLALLLAACGGLGGEPPIVATLPPPTQPPRELGHPGAPPDLAAGARIFAANCTRCHGASGAGDGELVASGQVPKMASFRDPETAFKVRPTEWFDVITDGRIDKLMPPWRDALTEEQRWDVTLYVYTLADTPDQLDAGATLYADHCAECHGDSGTGDGRRAGELSRPVGNLTDQIELAALPDSAIYNIVTKGQGTQMPAFADKLSDGQRRAVTAFVRTLSLANTSVLRQPVDATSEAAATVEATALPVAITGTVSGRVVNGTSGASVPANLPVTLYAISQTEQGFTNQPYSAVAGADGSYLVANVVIDPAKSYIASALYRGRVFTGKLVQGDELARTRDLPITLYELTEDPSIVKIAGIDIQVDGVGEGLQIVERVVFRNTSDRMYTNSLAIDSDRYASVVVGLPPGAVGIAFPDGGERFTMAQQQSVVVDSVPVIPGEDHVVQFSYFMPYDKGAVIEEQVYYTVDGPARLLVHPNSLTATSQQLAASGTETIQDLTYQVYSGSLALKAGDFIRYDLSGSAQGGGVGAAATGSQLPIVLIVGLVVEALIVGVLFTIYTRRRRPATPGRQTLIDALIRQIADLDNAHTAGKLDEAEYQTRRAQLKARLAELMQPDKS